MKRLLAFLVALLLAAVAQRTLIRGGIASDSAILFALAAVIFGFAAQPPGRWPEPEPRKKWSWVAVGMVLVGLGLGVAALVLFWSRRGTPSQYGGVGFWLWLAALALFLLGVWLGERRGRSGGAGQAAGLPRFAQGLARWVSEHRWELVILLFIMAAALFARVWKLGSIPNGCQSDECNNGLDALDWMQGLPYQPYAETNEGQATFFTFILAFAFRLLGATVPTMRLVSALTGTLTVLAFYLLARDLLDWRVALAASALLAVSRWHITFSRIVYELIMVPLFEALLFYYLLRALRLGRRRDWAMAGFAMSVGLNTYTGFRIVPFVVVAFLVYWLVFALVSGRWRKAEHGIPDNGDHGRWRLGWLESRRALGSDVEGLACFGGAAVITVLPLGVYIIQHWSVFLSRTRHISVFRDVERVGDLSPLWENLRKTLFMFNWVGDSAALNNLPGAPLLSAVVGVLFVLGIAYVLRFAYRPVPFLGLAWFVAVGSLAVLSVAHEAPTARRPIGLVPLIYLLVGLVIDQVWKAIRQAGWRGVVVDRVVSGLLAVLVLVVGVTNVRAYFVDQAQDPRVLFAYSPSESSVGEFLANLEGDPYILMTPAYSHHSAVRFIGQHSVTPLNLGAHVPLRQELGRDLLYVLEPVDERLGALFQQVYPGGTWIVHRDSIGRKLFVSFRVPQETLAAARGLDARYYQGLDTSGIPSVASKDPHLSFDWASQAPLDAPFSAVWTGALLVPRYGEYVVRLEVEGGTAKVLLDSEPLLDSIAEQSEIARTLAGGFHGLEVQFSSTNHPKNLRVSWSGPDFGLRAMGAEDLYTLPGATNGLVGYYYSNRDWIGDPAMIQRDLFILPNNPLREPFSIVWKGKVAAPRSGSYVFGTRSDDGSFVYIDDQLVVDNGGEHGSEYREGSIQLTEGFHDIEVRYFQTGGSREMQLWWTAPSRGQELIPSQYLFPLDEVPEGLELPDLNVAPPIREPEIRIPEDAEVAPGRPSEELPPLVAPPSLPLLDVKVLWQTGSCGDGSGEFQMPTGVAIDADGNVYVADAGNHRVVKLNPDGEPLLSWGSEGEGDSQFIEPFDLIVDGSGDLVVLDAVAHQLQRFSTDGELINRFGRELTLYRPRGLGVDRSDVLYIADTGGVRLLRASAAGDRLAQIGGPEQSIGPGQPTDVAVSDDGDIYLVEAMSGSLWWLDSSGSPKGRWPVAPANTLDSPHVALGRDGIVLVTNPEGAQVQVFEADGGAIGTFGSLGDGSGQFRKPVGIAVGSDGRVIITDSHACRVVALELQR